MKPTKSEGKRKSCNIVESNSENKKMKQWQIKKNKIVQKKRMIR